MGDGLDVSSHYYLDSSFSIITLSNGKMHLSMHVPAVFYTGIVGYSGYTKKSLETATNTRIYVPQIVNFEDICAFDKEVTITGANRNCVLAARHKILQLMWNFRKAMHCTHFLRIPLFIGNVRERFFEFQQQILAANIPGIDKRLFQIEAGLHLTLIQCKLFDRNERKRACSLLSECRQYLADVSTPFEIKVRGLQVLDHSLNRASAVYARAYCKDLQKFADNVQRHFDDSGYSFDLEQQGFIEMRLVLMSSVFRKKKDRKTADFFDAQKIFERWGDFDFGIALGRELQICTVGSKTKEGFETIGMIKF